MNGQRNGCSRDGSRGGFSLIELMIVVAIIGVLAAIAIPAFLKYTRQSKTTEAPTMIKHIVSGAIAWFDAPHASTAGNPLKAHFPTRSPHAAIVGPETFRRPSKGPCSNGTAMYKRNVRHWDAYPWRSLGFSIGKAHYYQYHYEYHNDNTPGGLPSFTATAHANLDCDTTLSTYQIIVKKNGTTGEAEIGQLIVTRALE